MEDTRTAPLDKLDRCDHIDVLEESVVRQREVLVELFDGSSFAEQVKDVVTENGEDFAVFPTHGRVPVSRIRSVIRAELKLG